MTTIKIRRGLSGTGTGKWGTVNPILDSGEFGFETDTGKLKIGDGSTAWNTLTYVTDASKLTGNTLAGSVLNSSLQSVGTLDNLTVTNPISGSITGNAGSATTATTATHVAGGALGRIPIQSGSGNTIFIGSSANPGQLLSSSPTSPYASWVEPVPYRMQVGKVTSTNTGGNSYDQINVVFPVAFDYAPVITVTATGTSTPTSVTISSLTTTGFTAYIFAGTGTNNSVWGAVTVARTIHWTAIQYGRSSAVSS